MSSDDRALAETLKASAVEYEASSKERKQEARKLRRVLREMSYVRAGVPGDGNCQFQAVSMMLDDSSWTKKTLRAAVVGHLRVNKDNYVDFAWLQHLDGKMDWDTYLAHMAKSRSRLLNVIY